jgi:hypothetical protein
MMKRRQVAAVLAGLASAPPLAQEKPVPSGTPAQAAKPAEAASTAQAAATDAPVFPTQLEQVIVDLVVTDKKGVPIKGLTAADMTVTEDGVKQDVVSFEAVELPDQPAAAAPPPPKVSSNTAPEEQRARTFVVVFDDMHITPWRATRRRRPWPASWRTAPAKATACRSSPRRAGPGGPRAWRRAARS